MNDRDAKEALAKLNQIARSLVEMNKKLDAMNGHLSNLSKRSR